MEKETPDYTSAINEVRNHAEELERRLDVIATSAAAPTDPTSQFRSFGSWVKAVAAGNEDAVALHRTFTGADSADSIMKNAWVSDTVRILNAGRPTYSVFSTGALPADGMNVEYPKVNTNTLAVAEQAAEGFEGIGQGSRFTLAVRDYEAGEEPTRTVGDEVIVWSGSIMS